jgi:hypothetical protein
MSKGNRTTVTHVLQRTFLQIVKDHIGPQKMIQAYRKLHVWEREWEHDDGPRFGVKVDLEFSMEYLKRSDLKVELQLRLSDFAQEVAAAANLVAEAPELAESDSADPGSPVTVTFGFVPPSTKMKELPSSDSFDSIDPPF